MSNIALISDTACDLNSKFIQEYGITLIPYYVSFDQQEYYKEIKDISIEAFYKRMRENKIFPKTSLPSINDYMEVFKPLVEQNRPIICVCLSGHFSGSYNSAVNARELILENYKDAQIEIINSLNATGGQGLLTLEIARMIQDDLSFDQVVKTAYELRDQAKIFFYVDDLEYLKNGGRIGKASALVGTMLNVKPIIYLENGELFPASKVRGKKKAMAKIIELTSSYVGDCPSNYRYMVGHADALDDANTVLELLPSEFKSSLLDEFFFIGTTIGVNTGPDTVGICVIPKYETYLSK